MTSLRVAGLLLTASVVLTSGPATALPVDPAPSAGAAPSVVPADTCRSVTGAAARTTRGPDHREVSPAEQRAIEARTDRVLASRGPAGTADDEVVPTYVHVMAGQDGEGDVRRSVVRRQVRVLDDTYAGTGFDFDLAGVDRTYDDRYHRDRRSREYRAATHRGGARALNLWLVDFDYLGVATFPWDQADRPELDGVRVDVGFLPGGSTPGYEQGETATHEVGHWLGLYHTFQGGCVRRNDEVRDTPAQSSPSRGCPVGRDSCSLRGDDPVRNYMDYTTDACYERFSKGQQDRMRRLFAAYRR